MMYDFNKAPFIYWSDIVKASFLQRQIIIHSIIYYHLNNSIISDNEYDDICKQLIGLKKHMPKADYKKTDYYYCFNEFDGNTGFYLYDALNEKDKIYLLKLAKFIILKQNG